MIFFKKQQTTRYMKNCLACKDFNPLTDMLCVMEHVQFCFDELFYVLSCRYIALVWWDSSDILSVVLERILQ